MTLDADTAVAATFADLPPETTIDSGPDDPTNQAEASFEFSSDDPAAGFECRLDDGSFSPCTSPKHLSGLSDGEHQFRVRAVDQAASTDQTPALQTWTVDTVAPETTIDSAPDDPTNQTEASFEFSSDDPAAGFECRLDGGSFSPCASPQNFSGLSLGDHTFEVKAIDTAGNVDPTPDSLGWRIEVTHSLTVTRSGSGQGTVLSSPRAINCGSECSAEFEQGTAVTLKANPVAGSEFVRWGGACSGTVSPCHLTIDAAKSVDAVFAARAPAAPSNLRTEPASPSNDASPRVSGAAESGSTVSIFKFRPDDGCVGGRIPAGKRSVGEGGAAQFADDGIVAQLEPDGQFTRWKLVAVATNSSGRQSPCSAPIFYLIDRRPAPAISVESGTTREPTVDIFSDQLRDDRGRELTPMLYANGHCDGAPIRLGADERPPQLHAGARVAVPFIRVGIEPQASTQFSLFIPEVSGRCSNSVRVFQDSIAPDEASIRGTQPDSPAADKTPKVRFRLGPVGRAEADTVEFYVHVVDREHLDANACHGDADKVVSRLQQGDNSTSVRVEADARSEIGLRVFDRAGNHSRCSSVSYLNRVRVPAPPSNLRTEPASPSNDASPRVSGAAESGSTVSIFKFRPDDGCEDGRMPAGKRPVGEGGAAQFADGGIAAQLEPDGQFTRWKLVAVATNSSGRQSPCSAPIFYLIDRRPAPAISVESANDPRAHGRHLQRSAPRRSGPRSDADAVRRTATATALRSGSAPTSVRPNSTPGPGLRCRSSE